MDLVTRRAAKHLRAGKMSFPVPMIQKYVGFANGGGRACCQDMNLFRRAAKHHPSSKNEFERP